MTDIEEKVIMTPKSKTATSTTIVIERKAIQAEASDKIHVAGGDHTGIIINKEQAHENGVGCETPCDCALTFRVWLAGEGSAARREARTLRFWFKPTLPTPERAHQAQLFFRELVSPADFPKDYVGYIKKTMKLMQTGFPQLRTLEVQLTLEPADSDHPPSPPPPSHACDWEQTAVEVSERRVLELIENAYPSPLSAEDVARVSAWDATQVKAALETLAARGLTRQHAPGQFVRQHSRDTQVVGTMPQLAADRQPRVAVVTALYCEKQAVDAIMDHQETFVRYTTLGESTVYTVGSVCGRGVVSTKLPVVGRSREALTAAGNAVTRLLGIFQKVEYVVMLGAGGGVAHYTDAARHVRLGDVVISAPRADRLDSFVYAVLTGARRAEAADGWEFDMKPYRPSDLTLQHVARELCGSQPDWDQLLEEGMQLVVRAGGCEGGFVGAARWAGGADRLCMPLGAGRYLEVQHPTHPDQTDGKQRMRVHLAPVVGAAGGSKGWREEARAAFAWRTGACATDCELDAVMDSVVGNRKDCFVNIRGIADYADGTVGVEWQGRASLAAAVVLRALLQRLPPNPLRLIT